jgi:serine/threonine protein phosphatase PrpC
VRLRSGVSSDRGLVRQTNEDSYLVRRGLYAVCDGMGGARAGEVASEMACRGLLELDPATASPEDLRDAIVEVDLAIIRRSLEEDGLLGMGTTLTAILAGERSVTLAHVGDSRAYLLHDNSLTQLSQDHSWVGEMVRRGELTPAQAAVHPHRSVITKALGTDGEVEPDILEVPVEEGDRLLICSDGLTGMVSDTDISALLRRDDDPQMVAELLVQSALAGGGEDNVTVVVVDILGSSVSPEAAEEGEDQAGDEIADDGILLGPDDRGLFAAARIRRIRRPGTAMRGHLGGRVVPLLRPPFGRARGIVSAQPAPAAVPPPGVNPAEVTAPLGLGASAAIAAAGPRRWTRRRWITLATVIVVFLAVVIAGFAVFNSTVYYVGAADGLVALYHGLPGSFLGIALSSVIERGTVAYDALAPHLQARVDTHDLVSKEEGQVFLRSLSATQ